MAWFRNHYICTACEGHWLVECVEVQDEHCPHCRAYDVTPYRSDDLTVIALKTVAATMRRADNSKAGGQKAARVALH
jgi:hypothetical protein